MADIYIFIFVFIFTINVLEAVSVHSLWAGNQQVWRHFFSFSILYFYCIRISINKGKCCWYRAMYFGSIVTKADSLFKTLSCLFLGSSWYLAMWIKFFLFEETTNGPGGV